MKNSEVSATKDNEFNHWWSKERRKSLFQFLLKGSDQVHFIWLVSITFLIPRIYTSRNIQFDMSPAENYMQYIDYEYIKSDFVQSLFFQWTYPPGMSIVYYFTHFLKSYQQFAISLVFFAVSFYTMHKILKLLQEFKINKILIFIVVSFIWIFNPTVLLYERIYLYTFLSSCFIFIFVINISIYIKNKEKHLIDQALLFISFASLFRPSIPYSIPILIFVTIIIKNFIFKVKINNMKIFSLNSIIIIFLFLLQINLIFNFKQFTSSPYSNITLYSMARDSASNEEWLNFIDKNNYPDWIRDISPVADWTKLQPYIEEFPEGSDTLLYSTNRSNGSINYNFLGYQDTVRIGGDLGSNFFIRNPDNFMSQAKQQAYNLHGASICWARDTARDQISELIFMYNISLWNFKDKYITCPYAGYDYSLTLVLIFNLLFFLSLLFLFLNRNFHKSVRFQREFYAIFFMTVFVLFSFGLFTFLGYGEHHRYRFEFDTIAYLTTVVGINLFYRKFTNLNSDKSIFN